MAEGNRSLVLRERKANIAVVARYAAQADIYDTRDNLWRVQEYHQVTVPWTKAVGPAAGTVYDLQSGRYLVMECSNEEPEFSTKSFGEEHFRTSNMPRVAANIR